MKKSMKRNICTSQGRTWIRTKLSFCLLRATHICIRGSRTRKQFSMNSLSNTDIRKSLIEAQLEETREWWRGLQGLVGSHITFWRFNDRGLLKGARCRTPSSYNIDPENLFFLLTDVYLSWNFIENFSSFGRNYKQETKKPKYDGT